MATKPVAGLCIAICCPVLISNRPLPIKINCILLQTSFMNQLTCANCGNSYTGQFCNQCGQKQVHRYTITHVLHELLHVFTHADKGIFSFGWQVLTRPGTVALDMVEGRRKRYFNLFQYLVLIVGISTFAVTKTHLMEQTMESVNNLTGTKAAGQMSQLQQQMVGLLQKYFNLLQFFLIPVYALFSWLYLRRNYNYAENIILNSVISAQVNTISVVITLFFFLLHSPALVVWHGLVSILVIISCFAVSFRQFFKISFAKALLYSLLVYVCAYVVQLVLITIILFVYMAATR